MIALPPDFRDFLQLLNEYEVKYLLVGGYAVALHDLRKNKAASGRYKDLNDLEHLLEEE